VGGGQLDYIATSKKEKDNQGFCHFHFRVMPVRKCSELLIAGLTWNDVNKSGFYTWCSLSLDYDFSP
jgi:hypothetical protein